MADITGNFNKAMPSGTSRKSDGDDLMRQHWGALGSTWTEEHHFTDSAKSAGLHKKGSARAYVKSTASASGPDRDGKIWLNSANSRAYILRDSSRTNLLGGSPNEQILHFSFSSQADRAPAVVAQTVMFSFTTKRANAASLVTFTFPILLDAPPTITGTIQVANTIDRPFLLLKAVDTDKVSWKVRDEEAHADDASAHTVHLLIVGQVSAMS